MLIRFGIKLTWDWFFGITRLHTTRPNTYCYELWIGIFCLSVEKGLEQIGEK